MTTRSSFVAALAVLALASIGIGTATQLALQNDGVKFPDGSVQTTAAAPPGIFVQGSVLFGIPEFSFCGNANVYQVPAGKRLQIEWMSTEIFMAPAGGDPVDIDVRTTLNSVEVQHPLVRLDNAINFGESFFFTQRWSGPVTIQSQSLAFVTIVACGASDGAITSVLATFHGRLLDQ